MPRSVERVERVVFVCTQNSARSQLATAVWHRKSPVPATSAGTDPATAVHPQAIEAARRHDLPLRARRPRHISDVLRPTDLVIAVCDNAHEELPADLHRLHWSIPDPVRERLTATRSTTPSTTSRCESTDSHPSYNQPDKESTMTDQPAAPATYLREELSIDQQLALRTAASRLQAEFADNFAVETIERSALFV